LENATSLRETLKHSDEDYKMQNLQKQNTVNNIVPVSKHSYMGNLKPSTAFKIASTNPEQLSKIEQMLPQFGEIRIINKANIRNGY